MVTIHSSNSPNYELARLGAILSRFIISWIMTSNWSSQLYLMGQIVIRLNDSKLVLNGFGLPI